MKKGIAFLLLFCFIFIVRAQNQNPPDILWKSLNSDHFKVIFPYEIESEAQRVAQTLEWAYKFDTKSLNVKPKPISIVLYNRSNKSNAYAALGPRRMGWYLTPPQSVTSLGNVDWVQTLAIHEYRHIVQYAKNRQHFTKFATYFFGDIGQSMMRWSIPDWFFEGDAIVMETALTNGGRGRIPAFAMNIRTYSLTGEKFTYDQAYLGSYKRYYPSHYHLGYPLTAYGRVNYGADVWEKVLDRTNRISWWPFAFGNSLKKYTGLNATKFYKSAMFEYDSIWKKQDSQLEITDFRRVNNKKKKNWTNYFNPQYDKEGNIICGKESLNKIAAFYKIDPTGKEKKLKNTDAGIFNIKDEKIIWSRTLPDIRWGEAAYADIVLYDLKTKKENRLTTKEQYLSPDLSPDGKIIAAIEHNNKQETKLVLLEKESGVLIKSYADIGGENDYLRTPVWSGDGDFVAFTHAKYKGSALSVLNVHTGEIKKIIDYNWNNIGQPVFYKGYLIYNSDYSGIGNIYAVEIQNGKQYQSTSSKYGAYNAAIAPNETKMVFQEYTKMGFDIAELELDTLNWKPLDQVKNSNPHYYKPLISQEGLQTIDSIPLEGKIYPISNYNKFKDGLKIHSWGIYPAMPYLDISVLSNNYLNTLSVSGGYLYNINEKTNTGYLSFSYAKYFPILTVLSSYGQRRKTYNVTNQPDSYTDEWEEFNSSGSIKLPFNLSRNVYSTNFSLNGGVYYTYTINRNVSSVSIKPNADFVSYSGGLSFSNYRKYAWRDFNPKWGQFFNLNYEAIPESHKSEGFVFTGNTSLYFPGILKHNSIKLSGGYEKQITYDPDNSNLYYFSSLLQTTRGYESYIYDKIYKFSADYQFPLWYPDISIGPLAYIKRIRLGAFYDYSIGYLANEYDEYESVGGSVRLEFNVFRINYPLEFGVQYAYRLNDGGYQISFLILGLPI